MIAVNGSTLSLNVLISVVTLSGGLAMLAAVAGTGGGSLFLPLFSLPVSDVHHAVPLSKAAVLGTSLGACFLNYTVGPDLINYPLVTLIQPATLLGCLFGVLLNLILPGTVITLAMCAILGFSAYKTFTAAKNLDEPVKRPVLDLETPEERHLLLSLEKAGCFEDRAQADYTEIKTPINGCKASFKSSVDTSGHLGIGLDEESWTVTGKDDYARETTPSTTNMRSLEDLIISKKHAEQRGQSSKPIIEFTMMAAVWAVNLLFLTLAGNAAALICGSPWQMFWSWCDILFLLGFMVFTHWRLNRLKIHSAELSWLNGPASMKYCSIAFAAGLGAAMLGIGGGLIKSPMLIAIGLLPVRAVATSNYMIVFTSSTNVLSYTLAGRLSPSDALLFTPVTFLGGVCGVWYLRSKFQKPRMQSMLARVLAWTIVAGGTAMLLSEVFNEYVRETVPNVNISEVCGRLQ